MSASTRSEVAEMKSRADDAFRAGDFAEAERLYTAAIDDCERRRNDGGLMHLLLCNRAAARLAIGGRDRLAAQDALQAADVDPTYVKAHFRAAVALERCGRASNALRSALRARELEPANAEVAALVERLRRLADTPAPAPAAKERPGVKTGGGDGGGDDGAAAAASTAAAAAAHAELTAAGCIASLPPELRAGAAFVPPPDGAPAANVLVLLHGLGDTAAPYAALAKRMALPSTACLALAGPIVVPETDGGRAWFTAFDDDFELIKGRPGETRRTSSLQRTADLLAPALEALGAPGRRVHLFGFSQGAAVALEMARRAALIRGREVGRGGGGGAGGQSHHRHRRLDCLASVVSISGALLRESLPELEEEAGKADEAEKAEKEEVSSSAAAAAPAGAAAASAESVVARPPQLAVLMTLGGADAIVSRSAAERSAALLRRVGRGACDIELLIIAGKGHAMLGPDRGEAEAVMRHWARVLAAPPPADGAVEVGGGVSGGGGGVGVGALPAAIAATQPGRKRGHAA